MARFIKESNVRKLAKENGRRVGRDFLAALDAQINEWLVRACNTHNGGKRTLDAMVAAYSRRTA